jgi:hypothetical protein
MNSTTLSLALRIAQLMEDHSKTELQEAISLLEKHGHRSELLDYLAQQKTNSRASGAKRKPENTRPRLEDTTSRAVLRLRDSAPDKFRLLSEFDLMVRRGQVLATHEDLKRFGERISKEFRPRKSRKETIGVLLATLAECPLPEIEKLIEFAVTFGVAGNTDEYQRLAQFIIKGRQAEG